MTNSQDPVASSWVHLAFGLAGFCKGAAMLGIIGVHIRPGWFGCQGVHVFLVLSGFLLATQLVAQGRDAVASLAPST